MRSDEGNRHDVATAMQAPAINSVVEVIMAGRFTCAPQASRRHAVERALHRLVDALHRAGADAQLACDLSHALAAT